MDIRELRQIYETWSRNKIQFIENQNFIEIQTPFLDMYSDRISLYLSRTNTTTESQIYNLTDDGYTMNELESLDFSPYSTKKRKSYFIQTLNTFGVKYNQQTSELYIEFSDLSQFPNLQQRLVQCILKISDMLLTAQDRVVNFFTEDIENFFLDNNVQYSTGSNYLGQTGNLVNFDFQIGRTRNQPEKLIKAINNPTGTAYIEPLFHIDDVRRVRPDNQFFIIANDTNNGISDTFISSSRGWNVEVLTWSTKENWVNQFAY